MIEKYNNLKSSSAVAIRPFVEYGSSNMGLEKYDMVVFEGIFHEEPIIYLENNGVMRFITGLNEFAPEVKVLPPDEKEAVVKQIREIVVEIEKEIATNILDPKDEKFWDKVKIVRPDNHEFWNKIILRLGNEPLYLNPQTDIYDLIKLKAIEAGGFSLVAPSLEVARKSQNNYKFYLDKATETLAIKTEIKKLRNKALEELNTLLYKHSNKLFYVAKILDPDSPQYKKSTPIDILFNNMDEYINGNLTEKDKKKAASKFLEIAGLNMENLKLRSAVKDATYYKIVAMRGDGFIYHMKTGTAIGKNPSDIIEFLKNPINEDVMNSILKEVDEYWNL